MKGFSKNPINGGMDSQGEQRPLLADDREEGVLQPGQDAISSNNGPENTIWKPIIFIFFHALITDIAYFVSIAPQTRLFEDILCTEYYAGNGGSGGSHPDESQCKIQAVQGPVAELIGMQAFFNGLVGIVLGLYFGALADKIGRKPVFILSSLGTLLSMGWILFVCWMAWPLKLTWLSSFFFMIGGGDTVGSACLTMILTDTTTVASRSKIFLYFSAANLGSEVIAPPIASYFIDNQYWVPLLIGVGCSVVSVIIAIFTPETLPNYAVHNAEETNIPGQPTTDAHVEDSKELPCFTSVAKHAANSMAYIYSQPVLFVCVAIFLVSDFARQSLQFLLQYVSARYGVSLGQANYILSWRALAAIVLNTIILPLVDELVQKKMNMLARQKDILLARISLCILTCAFIVLAVAPSIPVIILGVTLFTLGKAFPIFLRSVISTMVEPHRSGSVYTALAIMNTIGVLIAGPLMAESLKWSVGLHGVLQGLPYFFSSIICGLAAAVVLALRFPKDAAI